MATTAQAAVKVIYPTFNLSSVAGRTALLCGITAGTVLRPEIEAAVMQDIEKRPYRKPVVVPYGRGRERRFDSVRKAALYLAGVETGHAALTAAERVRIVQRIEKRISNYCNADNVPHYYWAA